MNSCNGQQLLVLVAFLLQFFVLGIVAQGTANKCWAKSTKEDFKKISGAIRIVYRVDALPNKLSCLSIKAANFDAQKGELAFLYKSDEKRVEIRHKILQQKDGSVKYVLQGKELPLHVEVKPNGIFIMHICNPPRGEQNILVGFTEGKGLIAQADAEIKKIAIINANQYRVQHPATCKSAPPKPGDPPVPAVKLAPVPPFRESDFDWADTKLQVKRSGDKSTDDLPSAAHEEAAESKSSK